MFTGDAGEVTENEFLNAYTYIPQIDVLKVGHHGSKTSYILIVIHFHSNVKSFFQIGSSFLLFSRL